MTRNRVASGTLGALLMLIGSCGGNTQAGEGDTPSHEPCAMRSIEEHCSKSGGECPSSPQDISAACDQSDVNVSRGATDCGSVVNVEREGSTERYYFDSGDRLVGFARSGDEGPNCGDGGVGPGYGKVCEPRGEPIELCNAACQLGSLSDYCSERGRDCPTSANAVAIRCDSESATYRYANACGGVNVLIVVLGAIAWSFDDQGRLIGTSGAYDSEQFCDGTTMTGVHGKFCAPIDDGQNLCMQR